MKRILIWILISVTPIILSAQDRTPVEISDFDEIRASGNLEVILQKGDSPSAAFVSEGLDYDMIVIENKRNVLKAGIKPGFHGSFKVKVYVTYTLIHEIQTTASARVTIREVFEGDRLNLNASSSGLITLETAYNTIDAKADSGAEIKISGKTEQLNASATTGAIFSGFDLDAENAYLKAGTGGKIEASVSKLLEASATAGGKITYRGNPDSLSINETLGGSVSNE